MIERICLKSSRLEIIDVNHMKTNWIMVQDNFKQFWENESCVSRQKLK